MTPGADFETIRLETDGHVATLLLNRPDRLNSFTAQMWAEMRTLGQRWSPIRATSGRSSCAGEGRAFSSGIDTSVFASGPGIDGDRRRCARPARRPEGQRDPQRAGRLHLARRGAVRHHRRDPRLRARRRSPARARVRHPGPRARHPARAARAQVRDPSRPRRHPAAAPHRRIGQGHRADHDRGEDRRRRGVAHRPGRAAGGRRGARRRRPPTSRPRSPRSRRSRCAGPSGRSTPRSTVGRCATVWWSRPRASRCAWPRPTSGRPSPRSSRAVRPQYSG